MKFQNFTTLLLAVLISSHMHAQTADTITAFSGIHLTNEDASVLIPLHEKITVKTGEENFKGTLDAIGQDHITIDGNVIQRGEIAVIKYIPAKKRRHRNAFLLSAPISFAGAIGFGFWYLGSGGEWTNLTATALLIYSPIGLITGTILSQKDKFRMSRGWQVQLIE